jgi:hypothetical protein
MFIQKGPLFEIGKKRPESDARSECVAQQHRRRAPARSFLFLKSGTVFEAPAVVAGLDDVAVMGEPIKECCCHLGVTEDRWPFAECKVCCENDRGALVKSADEMEQQLASGLGEGQITQFVEHDEVEAGQILCKTSLLAGAGLDLQAIVEPVSAHRKTKSGKIFLTP